MANSRDDIHDPTGQRTNYAPLGFLRAWGTAAPTSGTSSPQIGCAPGCIYQMIGAASPGSQIYVNVGTAASPIWSNIDGPDILPATKYTAGTSATTFAAGDLTGAQLTVYANTGANPGSLATRTMAQMFADITGAYVGMSWVARVVNFNATGTLTITAGNGVTLAGTTTYTVGTNAARDFQMVFTSATALTMTNIMASAAATN